MNNKEVKIFHFFINLRILFKKRISTFITISILTLYILKISKIYLENPNENFAEVSNDILERTQSEHISYDLLKYLNII